MERGAKQHVLDVGQVVEARERHMQERRAEEEGRDGVALSMVRQSREQRDDAVLQEEGGEAVKERAGGRQDRFALSVAQSLDDGLPILDKQSPAIPISRSKHGDDPPQESLPRLPSCLPSPTSVKSPLLGGWAEIAP